VIPPYYRRHCPLLSLLLGTKPYRENADAFRFFRTTLNSESMSQDATQVYDIFRAYHSTYCVSANRCSSATITTSAILRSQSPSPRRCFLPPFSSTPATGKPWSDIYRRGDSYGHRLWSKSGEAVGAEAQQR